MLTPVNVCIVCSLGSFILPLKKISNPVIEARANEIEILNRSSGVYCKSNFERVIIPMQKSDRNRMRRIDRYFRLLFIT